MQHAPRDLFWNCFCNRSRVRCSSERVKLKPASSTALNVKWKHQLGCITVYILWIGITCSVRPARSEVSLQRERERERLEKTGRRRKDWESGGRKTSQSRGRKRGRAATIKGLAKGTRSSFSHDKTFLFIPRSSRIEMHFSRRGPHGNI